MDSEFVIFKPMFLTYIIIYYNHDENKPNNNKEVKKGKLIQNAGFIFTNEKHQAKGKCHFLPI